MSSKYGHRHRWSASQGSRRRVCLDCGAVQVKVKGKWKPYAYGEREEET